MESETVKTRSLPSVLRMFLTGTVVMGLLAVAAEFICARWLGLDRIPYNGMTLGSKLDFADLAMFPPRFDHFHTTDFFSHAWGSDFLYPAPIAVLYWMFHLFPDDVNFFLAFVSLCFVCLTGWLFRELRRRGVAVAGAAVFASLSLVFSYPAYFEFNRANMEIFVWGLSALGILLLVRNRPWMAAVCIGLAGACKGYPFFYLGLFLMRKRYREMIFSLLVGAVANVVSLWAVAGNFGVGRAGTAEGLDEFQQLYVLRRRANEMGLDHSIFGFVKRFWVNLPSPERLQRGLWGYLVTAGLIAIGVFLWRLRKLPVINQVLFVTVTCITLPPTSYDYTLLHLYTPWVMIVFFAVEAWKNEQVIPRELWPVCICFMVLLSAQSEMIWHGERVEAQIKCVVLLVLAALAAWKPLGNRLELDPARAVA